MKNSFGFGTLVGSGHQSNSTTRVPMITIGSARTRNQTIWRRAQRADAGVLARDQRKPSTNTNCQASGLKNQVPDTGQVGSVRRKASAQI